MAIPIQFQFKLWQFQFNSNSGQTGKSQFNSNSNSGIGIGIGKQFQFRTGIGPSSGYWSVPLHDESKLLTTFNSPFGRFCFRRLPFGLNLSQDVFQERMDCILEKCPGTISIADDVGVFGKTKAEHDKHVHNLMRVAQQHGLVFNIGKCEISQPSMTFFGLKFGAEGVRPDPGRIKAIQQLKAPQNVTQLQEFLGIATYMSPFIPNLSQQTANLRDLVKKDVDFIWTASHNAVFETTKEIICRQITLAYFDPQAVLSRSMHPAEDSVHSLSRMADP